MKYPRLLRVVDLIRTGEAQVRLTTSTLPSRITVALAELPVGTLVTLELRRAFWDRRPRSLALRSLEKAMDKVRALDETVVVAAAIVRGKQVLSGQRGHPPQLAGRWEFPGGKVEKGETPQCALVRECKEELSVAVTVGAEIARERLDDGAVLILFETSLVDPDAEPRSVEHTKLRWLSAGQLMTLDWLSQNRAFLPDVLKRL